MKKVLIVFLSFMVFFSSVFILAPKETDALGLDTVVKIVAGSAAAELLKGVAEKAGIYFGSKKAEQKMIDFVNNKAMVEKDPVTRQFVEDLNAKTVSSSENGWNKYVLDPLFWLTGADIVMDAYNAFQNGYTSGTSVGLVPTEMDLSAQCSSVYNDLITYTRTSKDTWYDNINLSYSRSGSNDIVPVTGSTIFKIDKSSTIDFYFIRKNAPYYFQNPNVSDSTMAVLNFQTFANYTVDSVVKNNSLEWDSQVQLKFPKVGTIPSWGSELISNSNELIGYSVCGYVPTLADIPNVNIWINNDYHTIINQIQPVEVRIPLIDTRTDDGQEIWNPDPVTPDPPPLDTDGDGIPDSTDITPDGIDPVDDGPGKSIWDKIFPILLIIKLFAFLGSCLMFLSRMFAFILTIPLIPAIPINSDAFEWFKNVEIVGIPIFSVVSNMAAIGLFFGIYRVIRRLF